MNIPEKHPILVLAEGGAWHEADLLRQGYTIERLAKARKTFGIVSWRDRFGGWHYPRWQFDAELNVLPSVVEILRLLRSFDSLYVLGQFLRPIARKKTLIQMIRSGRGDKAVALVREEVRQIRAEPRMKPEDLKELKRRVHELRDPVRYVVVSTLLRGWTMVYDVANNVYCNDHVSEGCLIKDEPLAKTIAKQLGEKRRSDLQVLPVRKTKAGFRALASLPGGRGHKPWRPRFPKPDNTPVFVPIAPSDTRESFVDAMLFAAENRDEIMKFLSECRDRRAAHQQLVKKCGLSPRQAEAVLEMRLHTMTQKSIEELKDELRKASAVTQDVRQ